MVCLPCSKGPTLPPIPISHSLCTIPFTAQNYLPINNLNENNMSSPLPSPKTPGTRRRLSSFHKPCQTPQARTPLRPISTNRLSTIVTPHRTPPTATPARRTSRRASRRLSRRPSPQLSHAEIAAMYSQTIKLCQDNKITARNTWSLNLIDYMPMLFKTQTSARRKSVSFADGASPTVGQSAEDTNFQLAGVTLDAGVRIYCSRVDSVHTNAFKVLGGLAQTGTGVEHDVEEGEVEDGDENAGRRRRGRRTGRVTLESNLGNITSQKLETDLAVDPLFQKMSAAFDEGGAKGMLLNNLPVGPRGQVIFDSGELAENLVAATGDDAQVADAVYDVSGILPATAPGEGDVLCAGFLGFYRAKKSVLDRAATLEEGSLGGGRDDDTDAGGGFEMESCDPGVDFDYNSNDLQNVEAMGVFAGSETQVDSSFSQETFEDEDDVNVFGHAEDNPRRASLESTGSLAFAARRGSLDLVEAGMVLSENSEYSFFDTATISSWAGPQHWRFRATQTSSTYGDSTEDMTNGKKPKRPRGKTAMLLDFSSEAPNINFAKEFAQGTDETSYHLSKTVQDSFSEKKVTLPEDLHFSARSLASLFLKPNTFVRPKKSRPGAPHVETERDGWYDFDNDCDVENFCPDNGDGGTFPNDSSFENDASFTTEMDLVPEPSRIEKIDINYAKVAKKVDVRQLKSGMWSQLCGMSTSSSDAGDEPGDKSTSPSKEENEAISGFCAVDIRHGKTQTLQEVVDELPAFVPETSLPDVSLPYVFICLLHLANEKTLKITQAGDGSLRDLVITSGTEDSE